MGSLKPDVKPRPGCRLRALGGNAARDPALQVINTVSVEFGRLNDTQQDAPHTLPRIFGR